jgi:septal ring factor EnvC (AmiA/AmiB activator)
MCYSRHRHPAVAGCHRESLSQMSEQETFLRAQIEHLRRELEAKHKEAAGLEKQLKALEASAEAIGRIEYPNAVRL